MTGLSTRVTTAILTVIVAATVTATIGAAGPAWSVPSIQQVAPASLTPQPAPQTLTVTGRQFARGLRLLIRTPGGGTLDLHGDAIQAQTDTAFQVTVALTEAGRYSLVVTNPDGGASDPFVLELQARGKPPAPVITRVSPDDLHRDPLPQQLKLEGLGFVTGAQVSVTGPTGEMVPDVSVSRVTTTSIEFRVLLNMAGTYEVAVILPSGVASNVAVFDVH